MLQAAKEKPVLLFDGVCNLCNKWVNFIIDRDPDAAIRFAPLQSAAGRTLLESSGYDPEKMDTVILIDKGNNYERSDAVLQLVRYLRGSIRLLRVMVVIPRPARDFIYNVIARHRYGWFGKRTQCRVPEPGIKERFLEFSDDFSNE